MVNDKARRSVIQFEDVSFEYPGAETDSIHHISLDVKEGEFLVLTGGSGCGKTTLTRLVNGLGEQFYEGTLKGRITLLGRNISEYPLYEIGKRLNLLFSRFHTYISHLYQIEIICPNEPLTVFHRPV